MCPFMQAMVKGVLFSKSKALILISCSSDASRITWTTLSYPCLAAKCNRVHPFLSIALISNCIDNVSRY
eukprot:12799.XXX_709666_709872_1 [CDS] Oithona nana genome sequencing.